MKVFLCGGGAGEQTIEANKRLNEVIDHTKPCLYIPLAMEADMYDSCYKWITGELKDLEIPHIDMVRSAEELAEKDLSAYSVLFIGGGNTYKLLYDIKRCGMFEKIREYLENGGVAFGGSAGAIIFGEDLESCQLDDPNEVGLKETAGYDVLGGISLLCHYTSRALEEDEKSKEFLLSISDHRRTLALPEEVTVFVNDDKVEIIGDRPYFYFEKGEILENYFQNH
ncbi:MAG: Type 1 glutamine amidotransferase-like domain-containing protein [Lachnospiraceae bacterium]|nr:Type 1 glutamine amidotransferase-like domain-containing protein [Lachnospiraceae bacterium]